jgi:menaquinone-dependent protoporphyrinogen IX oxidase
LRGAVAAALGELRLWIISERNHDMTPLRCLLVLPALLVVLSAYGGDVASGPEKGAKLPALPVYDATGPNKEKEVNYVADRKEKATLYVFIQADKFDRPMARFLKKLDEGLKDDSSAVIAVWLTDDATKTKDYLPRAQQSLKLEATALTCFTGDKAGPKDWNINADAHVTVVVASKNKVAATLGYRSINETDVPKVQAALKKASKE